MTTSRLLLRRGRGALWDGAHRWDDEKTLVIRRLAVLARPMRLLRPVFVFHVALVCASALSASDWVPGAAESVVRLSFEDSQGTGFIVSADGLILTAAHVVPHDHPNATVDFSDGRTAQASFVSFSEDGVDLAAYRLDGIENTSFLEISSGPSPPIGASILVIGNPFPLYPSLVSDGLLGHHRRSHNILVYNSAISSGSSGGPLLDQQGRVVGVTTAMLLDSNGAGDFGSGFNLALDTQSLQRFMGQIAAGRVESAKQGHVEFLRYPLTELRAPSVFNGRLDANSDRLAGSLEYADGFVFSGLEDEGYLIEMTSEALDPYLMVYFDDGEAALENDDAEPGSSDAAIVLTPFRDERFTIVTTTFEVGETGNYGLAIKKLAREILLDVDGILASGDFVAEGGQFFKDYELRGVDGQIVVNCGSDDVDSYLEIYSADGTLLYENDDRRVGDLNSRIDFPAEAGVAYRVRVRSFEPGQSGKFQLKAIGFTE